MSCCYMNCSFVSMHFHLNSDVVIGKVTKRIPRNVRVHLIRIRFQAQVFYGCGLCMEVLPAGNTKCLNSAEANDKAPIGNDVNIVYCPCHSLSYLYYGANINVPSYN